MASLTDKILKLAQKNNKNPVSVLKESGFIKKEVLAKLPVPILNIAHSGNVEGEDAGITFGSHQILGESKTFKTLFGIIQVKAFMDAYKDSTCVFIDSEFGANEDYWKACEIDMNRVIHIPVRSVEEMMNVVIPILEETDVSDNVVFFVDSVGQLGSKKELENSMTGEAGKQDFTRAKSLNSFWRLAIPAINLAKVPFFWIGGIYDTTDQYNPLSISGGKKGELGSDTIWLITKSKNKETVKNEVTGKSKEEQTGWVFNIKIYKSRFVVEGSVFPVCVRYDGGVDKYYGILDIAREVGAVDMPSNGWYCRTELIGYIDDKKVQKSSMDSEWFESIIKNEEFQTLVRKKYMLTNENLLASKDEQ
jgi:hypothetical protein